MKKKIGKKVVPKLHQLCRNFEAASDKSLAISTFHVIGMVTGHQTNKHKFQVVDSTSLVGVFESKHARKSQATLI